MRDSPSWKCILSTVAVIGAALFSATASAALAAIPASQDPTTQVVTIGVIVSGARPGYVPLGSVTFTESNDTLGTVDIKQGPGVTCDIRTESCIVSLTLDPAYALGPHAITTTYLREQAGGPVPPEVLTFTFDLSGGSGLSWLPAVLDLLSD